MSVTNKDGTVQYGQGRSPNAVQGRWDKHRCGLIGLIFLAIIVCTGIYLYLNP